MRNRQINSNVEWQAWGRVDPLYAVASWEGRNKDGTNPWTSEEFYQLGKIDWQRFLSDWKKYGVDSHSCLEIGCGAGRLTMHIAQCFKTTHALDISIDMIDYAREHINNHAVQFHLSNGIDIPLSNNSVSAAFSSHVFQHFDSLLHASAYFAEISRVLRSEGSLMIHLPIYQWPSTTSIETKTFNLIYSLRKHFGDLKASAKRRLITRGLSRPIMRMLQYPVTYFYETLPKYNFIDIEVHISTTPTNNDLHSFVFARKK